MTARLFGRRRSTTSARLASFFSAVGRSTAAWIARRRRTQRFSGPPAVPPGHVEVTTAELDALLADIHDGMAALRERIEFLEVALMIETAMLEAVIDHE